MISIHIEAHPDRGNLKQQVDDSLAAIGFSRQMTLSTKVDDVIAAAPLPMPVASDVSADSGPGTVRGASFAEGEATKPAPKPRGRPSKKDEAPITPPAPEPEVEAQDATDEAEEAAAAAPEADIEVFTLDTVRHAMGEYVRAYGIEFAQTDVPSLIGAPKVSMIPDTQEALSKATLAVRDAVRTNPHNRASAQAGA